MSKFVLRAANWVKIASCHCGFGTVLTLTVTFGRVFVYSLPSSSSACAGGHSNHRNVSVIGSSDSLRGVWRAPSWPRPRSSSPPQAATRERRGGRDERCRDWNLPFMHSSSNGLGLLSTAGGT